MRALEGSSLARATPLLARALADDDLEVRVTAARVAATLRAPAVDAIAPWLTERDARLRLAAAEYFRRVPDPRAVAALARALGDPDSAVRAAAAEALGALAGSAVVGEAASPLLGHLEAPPPARLGGARARPARAGRPRVAPGTMPSPPPGELSAGGELYTHRSACVRVDRPPHPAARLGRWPNTRPRIPSPAAPRTTRRPLGGAG